jgi:hypothetical protein
MVALGAAAAEAQGTAPPPAEAGFAVTLDVVLKELHPDWCWFHPRAAAIPGEGREGAPAVVLTLQRHLVADDHYSGLYYMRSNDLGRNWTTPTLPPALDWQTETETGETLAVCDVTPLWHPPSGRLLAIGTRLRYSPAGAQLEDRPGSFACAYASYDPRSDAWTAWRTIELPSDGEKFYTACPGCVQWLVRADGTLLLPIYFRGRPSGPYAATVLHCRYDGESIEYLRHGEELTLDVERGLCEPSLAAFRGKYYLTLRNDQRGYVAVSDDGLHYGEMRPWTFDDGTDLGSYNTQQHWLTGDGGLYLAYTRRGADNDHIARNRAPLFLARVDPDKLHVLRHTEQVLIPERGVMLGNFGAAAITPEESWVTDAEFVFGDAPHPRGADGSVFAARVRWQKSRP